MLAESHADETPLALAPSPPLTDWTLRPFAASARSPLWLGLAAVVGVTVVSQLYRVAAGDIASPFRPGDAYLWVDVLNALLLAYVPVAAFYLRRGRLRDLHELRPALRCDDAAFEELAASAVCVPGSRKYSGRATPLSTAGFRLTNRKSS